MKALSLYQPYASLIALSAKKIETRSWPTPHRGLLEDEEEDEQGEEVSE